MRAVFVGDVSGGNWGVVAFVMGVAVVVGDGWRRTVVDAGGRSVVWVKHLVNVDGLLLLSLLLRWRLVAVVRLLLLHSSRSLILLRHVQITVRRIVSIIHHLF